MTYLTLSMTRGDRDVGRRISGGSSSTSLMSLSPNPNARKPSYTQTHLQRPQSKSKQKKKKTQMPRQGKSATTPMALVSKSTRNDPTLPLSKYKAGVLANVPENRADMGTSRTFQDEASRDGVDERDGEDGVDEKDGEDKSTIEEQPEHEEGSAASQSFDKFTIADKIGNSVLAVIDSFLTIKSNDRKSVVKDVTETKVPLEGGDFPEVSKGNSVDSYKSMKQTLEDYSLEMTTSLNDTVQESSSAVEKTKTRKEDTFEESPVEVTISMYHATQKISAAIEKSEKKKGEPMILMMRRKEKKKKGESSSRSAQTQDPIAEAKSIKVGGGAVVADDTQKKKKAGKNVVQKKGVEINQGEELDMEDAISLIQDVQEASVYLAKEVEGEALNLVREASLSIARGIVAMASFGEDHDLFAFVGDDASSEGDDGSSEGDDASFMKDDASFVRDDNTIVSSDQQEMIFEEYSGCAIPSHKQKILIGCNEDTKNTNDRLARLEKKLDVLLQIEQRLAEETNKPLLNRLILGDGDDLSYIDNFCLKMFGDEEDMSFVSSEISSMGEKPESLQKNQRVKKRTRRRRGGIQSCFCSPSPICLSPNPNARKPSYTQTHLQRPQSKSKSKQKKKKTQMPRQGKSATTPMALVSNSARNDPTLPLSEYKAGVLANVPENRADMGTSRTFQDEASRDGVDEKDGEDNDHFSQSTIEEQPEHEEGAAASLFTIAGGVADAVLALNDSIGEMYEEYQVETVFDNSLAKVVESSVDFYKSMNQMYEEYQEEMTTSMYDSVQDPKLKQASRSKSPLEDDNSINTCLQYEYTIEDYISRKKEVTVEPIHEVGKPSSREDKDDLMPSKTSENYNKSLKRRKAEEESAEDEMIEVPRQVSFETSLTTSVGSKGSMHSEASLRHSAEHSESTIDETFSDQTTFSGVTTLGDESTKFTSGCYI